MSGEPDLVAAVEQAVRAPSVHNTQPWRWRIHGRGVELYADPHRHLPATDPERRDLVLSCGAALHHLRVVLAAAGHATRVERTPDPDRSDLLARIELVDGEPDPADAELFPAIAERRTERRRMSHRPVPPDVIERLAAQAQQRGALLVPVTAGPMRARLDRALAEAEAAQAKVPGYAAELARWTHRFAGARDGVDPRTVAAVPPGLPGRWPLRRFTEAALRQPQQVPAHAVPDDAAEFLVVVTAGDDVVDRLRAGEATSAVLLAATREGLATTPLSQGIEVESTRTAIRRDVLRIPETPQLIIRVGWPATYATTLPRTPRRSVDAVLMTG
ncbi:Nitroreductase family protein [Pseudonocardia thermophila]|uniref:Nitroreductase family protein n=1 Tax=Pseudonocardia thermophila TaxID=1848 RepID=A0A1M6V1C4_PSETH|nr:nitroreductase family protein [Pseudonocardia thermophila]SHK75253.1 Nitroreductase family protein [Pseudonocardia thermophila]